MTLSQIISVAADAYTYVVVPSFIVLNLYRLHAVEKELQSVKSLLYQLMLKNKTGV